MGKPNKTVTIAPNAKKHDAGRGPSGMSFNGAAGDEESGGFTQTSNSMDDEMDLDESMLSKRYATSRSSGSTGHLHMLTTYRPGESKVEKLAKKITTRLDERIPVTFGARKKFLRDCRKIATKKGYDKLSRIHYSDLLEYHDANAKEADDNDVEGIMSRTAHSLGIFSDKQCLKDMLKKAKRIGQKVELHPEDEFYYQDFNFFHTELVSAWPFIRYQLLFAFGLVFLFYLATPILFCLIMRDEGVCPQDAKVPGWVSALYFASTTMSTVGYGDLSVEKDDRWRIIIGLLYMIASLLVALLAFSAAAETATSPIRKLIKRFSPDFYPEGPLKDGEMLHMRVRKVRFAMLGEIFLQFTILNFIGIFSSQLFIAYAEVDPERKWDWIDSCYWAVQTTTTIGYGDYAMPDYMRAFQIFYLTLGTYFTGNALGKLSTMKEEIEEIRRHHAFERREVNKYMMHYLASTDDPTRVDQYEFVIASLLNLGKINADDIGPIMNKFRSLAKHSGNSGYIRVEDVPEETDAPLSDGELERVEGELGA